MRVGDRGPAVVQFQRNLIAAGYRLPRWGADGAYGEETDGAAALFASREGLAKADGAAGDALQAHLAALLARRQSPATLVMPSSIVDTRNLHDGHKRLRRRGWGRITNITFHQTATCYLMPGGSPERVRHAIDRVSNIGVHGVVMRPGFSVLSNDPTWEMPQAQYFNPTGIGIEIDGRFCGVEGDTSPESFWVPRGPDGERLPLKPMAEAPAQTRAAIELVDYLIALVKANGGRIQHVFAHRQTSATRRSDPGEMIWKTIVIPTMEKHGLTYGGPEFFVRKSVLDAKGRQTVSGPVSSAGPGRPIPRQWDPTATAEY